MGTGMGMGMGTSMVIIIIIIQIANKHITNHSKHNNDNSNDNSNNSNGHGHGLSGGTRRATSANTPLLRLQSSEGKFTMSREYRARTQALLQARKLHVYRSGTSGAFWGVGSEHGPCSE